MTRRSAPLVLAMTMLFSTGACSGDPPRSTPRPCWTDAFEAASCELPASSVMVSSVELGERYSGVDDVPGIDVDCMMTEAESGAGFCRPDAEWVYGDGVDSWLGDAFASTRTGVHDALEMAFDSGEYSLRIDVEPGGGPMSCASVRLSGEGFLAVPVESTRVAVVDDVVTADFGAIVVNIPPSDIAVALELEPAVLQARIVDGAWSDIVLAGVVDREETVPVFMREPLYDDADAALRYSENFVDVDRNGDGMCEAISAAFVLLPDE